MKRFSFSFFFIAILLNQFAIAGPGHDHSHDHAPSTNAAPALPRFSAQSDLFDAVGVLGKDELIVFIDRAATNEPVLNATVELESGSVKAIGAFVAALGEYHFDGKPFQQKTTYPITLTIKAGNDTDLLSADLEVLGGEGEGGAHAAHVHSWREYLAWIAGAAIVVIAAAGALIAVRRKKSRLEFRERGAA